MESALQSFLRALRDLGWIEGQNLRIEYRWAEGKVERWPDRAAESVSSQMDRIVAPAASAALAAKVASSTIPIVMIFTSIAVTTGLVASLRRPGGSGFRGAGARVGRGGRIAGPALKASLPAMFAFRESVKVGGMMARAVHMSDVIASAAGHVAKILRDAKPADLPVEQPMNLELVVRLKTARTQVLAVPPSLLMRADELMP